VYNYLKHFIESVVEETGEESLGLDLTSISFVSADSTIKNDINSPLKRTLPSFPSDITFNTTGSNNITIMAQEKVKLVTFRVLSRNDEKFVGALSRKQVYEIWEKSFVLPTTLLHGISVVQTSGKPFLFDCHLHSEIELSKIPKSFEYCLDGAVFKGDFVRPEDENIPLLGEDVKIYVRKTRFQVSIIQLKPWLSVFGEVVTEPEYIRDDELTHISTDDITCQMKLKKHIYNQLPAFGRKLRISYKGQPIQCGACFGFGHIRSECGNPRIDWLLYVKGILEETQVPPSMLGRWYELMKQNNL